MPSSRTTIATSLLCLAAISLSGCSLRYDNPPDALPQLNSGQSGISRATRAEEAISTAATSLSSDGSVSAGVQQVASYIADTSASQLSAMGGVWNPWPEGRPDGAQSGPAPVEVPSNLKSLLLLLVDTSAQACRDANTSENPTNTALLAGVCAAKEFEAWRLANAAGLEIPAAAKPFTLPQSNPEGNPAKVKSEAGVKALSQAVAALDFSRYRTETAAAHLSPENRLWARNRAEALTQDVDYLVRRGAKDPRASQYSVDFSTLDQPQVATHLMVQAGIDAFAAHLQATQYLPVKQRALMLESVKNDVYALRHFEVEPSQIFSQLWP